MEDSKSGAVTVGFPEMSKNVDYKLTWGGAGGCLFCGFGARSGVVFALAARLLSFFASPKESKQRKATLVDAPLRGVPCATQLGGLRNLGTPCGLRQSSPFFRPNLRCYGARRLTRAWKTSRNNLQHRFLTLNASKDPRLGGFPSMSTAPSNGGVGGKRLQNCLRAA